MPEKSTQMAQRSKRLSPREFHKLYWPAIKDGEVVDERGEVWTPWSPGT